MERRADRRRAVLRRGRVPGLSRLRGRPGARAPAHWLGHGLGYGTWEYAAPTLTASEPAPVVDVPVTNTGDHESREVVQVYLDPADEDQPVRLVGWGSAEVPPAEPRR